MFSTLRLHALGGLKGDATECKSNFKSNLDVYTVCHSSMLRTKCFSFSAFMEAKFISLILPKKKKTFKEIFVIISTHVHKNQFVAS